MITTSSLRAPLGSCLLVLASACASFTDPALPERRLADFEGERRLPAITYEFMDASFLVPSEDLTVVAAQAQVPAPSILQSRVEPIFRRVFVESKRSKEPGPWHVDMYYRETERNPAITYTLGFLCIFSLGLIPAYGATDLYFEAKLVHEGRTVRQFVYQETISTWIHWLVLPWTFSCDPIRKKSEFIDNIVLNLVHDLEAELPPRPAAGLSPPAPTER
ncbi:MAG: hypothetical protein JNK02_01985 [Planctomycetes bacterium]|nr:hypothetical protein [Planctomycetota bacterium]